VILEKGRETRAGEIRGKPTAPFEKI